MIVMEGLLMNIGNQAPDFTLKNQNGEDIRLSDFVGKNVVLYFYPKDMTPGCTTQAFDFRDQHESFEDSDTIILCVSHDTFERYHKFVGKINLPFHLLAGEDHQVAELYGVWQLKKMFGREYYGIVRSTFIIDKEGILQKEMRNIRVKGHVDRALEAVKELN